MHLTDNRIDIEQESRDTEMMISNQFNDSTRLAYRLYACFMHQGSVEFGHYYIYIYDFEKDVWRKYNDNDITEVQDTSEIFGNPNRVNPPTPYFLVYVHDALKGRLVEPVRRDIIAEAPTIVENATAPIDSTSDEPMDAEMGPPSYSDVWTKGEQEGTQIALSSGSSLVEKVNEKRFVVHANEIIHSANPGFPSISAFTDCYPVETKRVRGPNEHYYEC